MGIKKSATFLMLCVAMLFCSSTVRAETLRDLYTIYSLDYVEGYPEGVLETIASYRNAQKYVAMYQYVASSEYDTSILDNRIDSLTNDLESLENELISGYGKSLSDIYELEDSYVKISEDLVNAKSSGVSYEVSYEAPTVDNTPTYAEYKNALQQKSIFDSQQDIGSINISYPVDAMVAILDATDKHLELAVPNNSKVTVLFNGTVSGVSDESVSINHGGNVHTYYGNLSEIYVSKGDIVYQGQVLGTTKNTLLLKMKISDNLVDIRKIFSEE